MNVSQEVAPPRPQPKLMQSDSKIPRGEQSQIQTRCLQVGGRVRWVGGGGRTLRLMGTIRLGSARHPMALAQ
eukprot:3051248-Pyramimonas_sp.AAC.1